MQQCWNDATACIIEISTHKSYLLDKYHIQGNPNVDRDVSYADVWKQGYYSIYEPSLNVYAIDESETQISDNIDNICRLLIAHEQRALFLGHLVDPLSPHPTRASNNAKLERAFRASAHGRVAYFDCSPLVEEYGFRILEDGSRDIHHLPYKGLDPLSKELVAALESIGYI